MKNIYLFNIPVSFPKAKRVTMTLLFALFALTVHAQVGIGTITPDGSAQLEISSPNKGLLIPRVLEATRTLLMPNPATGLLVYQTDGVAPGFYYYDGAAWQPLKAPAAAAGAGTIIPYASGTPITMITPLELIGGANSIVSFGSSAAILPALGGIIDASLAPNMAFSVPRSGTITSMSSTFSLSVSLSLVGSTVTVQAQLYSAPEGSNNFTPILGAVVSHAPGLSGLLSIGEIFSGNATGLSIPVTTGTRLLLVYSAVTSAGIPLPAIVTGYASAGVNIN
jgi:BclB C-terminal domain-containing protein